MRQDRATVVPPDSLPATGSRVRRFDRGELRPSHRTPEGFLFVDVYLAKPGVLEYEEFDGTVRRELVLPEELHRADSLGTLGGKAVTVEHPPEDVDPDNEGVYSVGTVDTEIEVVADGRVRVGYMIRRRDGIDYVDSGAREASPGYSVRIEDKDEHPPETVAQWAAKYGEFDVIQRDRLYNHAAITRQARGGRDIHLRADAAYQVGMYRDDASDQATEEDMKPAQLQALLTMLVHGGMKRTDAVETAVGMGAKREDAEAVVNDVESKTAFDRISERLDAIEAAVGIGAEPKTEPAPEEPKATDEAGEDPEDKGEDVTTETKTDSDFLAQCKERKRIERVAEGLRLDAKAIDELSTAALRKACVIAHNPNARADAKAEYYEAAFDMIEAAQKDATDPQRNDAKPDPYAGLIVVPKSGNEPTPEDRNDSAPAEGWINNANKQFAARNK